MRKQGHGFTLIELLVVIAIISLLSSIILASLNQSKEKAKIALAKQQLTQIRNAIELLSQDTGKGPNGCPLNVDSDAEMDLNSQRAGLIIPPLNQGETEYVTCKPGQSVCLAHNCKWTSDDMLKWKGPYIKTGLDPWGRPYQFDPDYYYHLTNPIDCTEYNPAGFGQAIYSEGPTAPLDGGGHKTDYPCAGPSDDLYLLIGEFPPR